MVVLMFNVESLIMLKLINRVVSVNGRRTSMRMCVKEWNALDDVCRKENISKNQLLGMIEDNNKDSLSLTYLTRLFILSYFRLIAKGNIYPKPCLKRIIRNSLTD